MYMYAESLNVRGEATLARRGRNTNVFRVLKGIINTREQHSANVIPSRPVFDVPATAQKLLPCT
jgi:hypothetical protein